jgi:hypothetical protein
VCSSKTIAAGAAVVALSACGGGTRQDVGEPSGNFTVGLPTASFPASQRLAERTRMVISVRNAGTKTIPNIAVTITDPAVGTAAQAFGELLGTSGGAQLLASRSRPVWIIDRPPGRCRYSCLAGGPGGAVTAYSNTWALGALRPGATATFQWGVTAVKAGTHVVQYQIAAGLNGKAKAVLADGRRPVGRFRITIHSAPQQSYVNAQGQVVNTP